jgi:hypothetical protein
MHPPNRVLQAVRSDTVVVIRARGKGNKLLPALTSGYLAMRIPVMGQVRKWAAVQCRHVRPRPCGSETIYVDPVFPIGYDCFSQNSSLTTMGSLLAYSRTTERW